MKMMSFFFSLANNMNTLDEREIHRRDSNVFWFPTSESWRDAR